MISAWNRFRWKRRRKRALLNIRREFAFWGLFMVDISDDELEERIISASQIFGGFGFPVEDVIRPLNEMMGGLTDE
ncbi:hypothetical protein [Brevibacillus laterosporus]|uniref:hypothetical protein n=1 Tax=Brevibacillus laterosporus TaxID=1465 RepID=UPI0018F877F7|nr:hypothetical protein [Brevibacillus laterosporus]MBG9772401.1 hypothetical protein [Brevibacillus laterosporus]